MIIKYHIYIIRLFHFIKKDQETKLLNNYHIINNLQQHCTRFGFRGAGNPYNWLEFTQCNTYIEEYDFVAGIFIG
ncbi:MAG TPA: hypothetical protein DDX86_02210 [Akkermansia sp.]|nr:hypothetical protein [Akkermansia sp.]